MKKIRDCFQQELVESLQIAHSLIAISSLGEEPLLENMKKNPESGHQFAIPIPGAMGIEIAKLNFMTWKDIFATYHAHKAAIHELVHAQMVQKWYDFLNQLFEKVVKDHFSGVKSYPKVPQLKVTIDFSIDNSTTLIQNIPERAREWFDFIKAEEKINKIEKILGIQIDQQLKSSIKKHIIVRNILEHNNGVIRDRDVKDLGSQVINLFDDSATDKDFKVGDRVKITFYELLRIRHDFHKAASIMIP
jgi:hypothetical protein